MPNFETLDARIATALKKIIQNPNLKRGPRKRSRRLEKMLYEYFRVLGSHEALLDFYDLMGVTLRGGDVLGFAKFEEKMFFPTRIVSRIKE